MRVLIVLVAVLALASANVIKVNRFMNTKRIQNRIVGGQDAVVGQFPYQVSIQWSDWGNICGAFVLSERYAGTAAHCLDFWDPEDLELLYAVVGAVHVNEGTRLPFVSYHWHPQYDIAAFADLDVGIVEVLGNFLSVPNVARIPLNNVDPPAGTQTTVSGWGTLASGGSTPVILQWADYDIVDRAACLEAYGSDISINNICAGYTDLGSCQGDSGGPLTWNGEVAGIVSWGYGCGTPGYPGVYANVASPEIYSFLEPYVV